MIFKLNGSSDDSLSGAVVYSAGNDYHSTLHTRK